MSLSFNIKQGQRIDLWLKASKPAAQPLFSIRVNGQVIFKIQEASGYFQYFTDLVSGRRCHPGVAVGI